MEKFNLKYDMYLLSMRVSYPEGIICDNDSVPQYFEIDKSFVEKELSKILPKNIVSGGYVCTVCETYLSNQPNAMCSLCYEHDLESVLDPNKDWFDLDTLKDRIRKLDYVFVTSSDSKCELTKDGFSKLENIEVLDFNKIEPYENGIEAQHIITFDGSKFIFTEESNEEVIYY